MFTKTADDTNHRGTETILKDNIIPIKISIVVLWPVLDLLERSQRIVMVMFKFIRVYLT